MRNLFILCFCLFAVPAYASQNIVIVLDDSGSMAQYLERGQGSRLDAAKKALFKVVESLPDDTRLGIVLLNGDMNNWFVPFGIIDKPFAASKISNLGCGGGTPLGYAMKVGCDQLLKAREKEKYGSYILLVVTDGQANDPEIVDAYVNDINTRGIELDVIGLDMRADHSLATKVDSYKNAYDEAQLTKAISDTFAETNPSDKSAADEDFEIINSLPDDVAVKVIAALGSFPNYPIGEKPAIKVNENGEIEMVAAAAVPVNSYTTGQKILIGLAAFVVAIIVLSLIGVIASS